MEDDLPDGRQPVPPPPKFHTSPLGSPKVCTKFEVPTASISDDGIILYWVLYPITQ